MAIVKDFMIGNTHVLIDDDCVQSKEQNEKAMAELTKKIQPVLVDQYLRMAEQGIDITPYVRIIEKD